MDTSAVETTKLVLDQLFGVWNKRAESYGKVLYGAALIREYGNWRIVLTFFLPLSKDSVPGPPLDADYGDFRITRGLLTLEDSKTLLKDLVHTQILALPDLPKVAVIASMHPTSSIRFVTSAEKRFPVEYPFTEFRFNVDTSSQGTEPYGRLYRLDLPTYPRGATAIEDLLSVHLGSSDAYRGVLVALAPDYRARIAELRLSSKGLQAQIECSSETREETLIGKLCCETSDGKILHSDLIFSGHVARFDAEGFPRHLVLGLLSKYDQTLIDERVFYSGASYMQSEVVLESSEQDIERLVLAGESSELEFKRELPAKREVFALGAAAFANSNGGRILVGIEDNGEIVGYSISNAKETISNILRDYCEPAVEFRFEELVVKGNPVLVVTVPAGKDKPYVVRNKGVYVRSGATNRTATRYELDRMYAHKSPL
jgi:hypothetical protein